MLLWVLFSVLGVYRGVLGAYHDMEIAFQYEEACAGKDYIFPPYAHTHMKSRVVLFKPRTQLDSTRVVMDETRVLDPRFTRDKSNVKLSDTSKDYDGRYLVILVGQNSNRTFPLLSLHVKDCSIKKRIEYGRSFSFEESRDAEQIDYSPFNDSKKPVIVWSRTKAVESYRGRLVPRWFVVQKPTYANQGFYTLRDKDGKYLERYSVIIEELLQNYFHKRGEDFTFSYPVDTVAFSLTYEPEHEAIGPVTLTTLIQNGHLMDRCAKDFMQLFSKENGQSSLPFLIFPTSFSERFEGRIELLSTGVEIIELEVLDAGTFKLLDNDGNLVLVVELTVTAEDFGINFIVPIVATVVAMVICVCCVKRCCCRKNSTTSTPVTQVYQHEMTHNDQRQSQPYAMVVNQPPYNPHKPLASAANKQPQASDVLSPPSNIIAGGGGDSSPDHVGPMHFQGSAAGGVDAPTVTLGFDCLSSDSGTQFEIPKGLNYLSAPPLSADTPSHDVYTSDKLNFL